MFFVACLMQAAAAFLLVDGSAKINEEKTARLIPRYGNRSWGDGCHVIFGVSLILLMVQKSHSQPPGMVLKPYKTLVNNGTNYQIYQPQVVNARFLPSV